jgi:hypothetical protein
VAWDVIKKQAAAIGPSAAGVGNTAITRLLTAFAMTVRAWRRAEITIAGWPQMDVAIPDRRRHWVSGWDRFRDSIHQDCQAWCDRLAGRDLLEDAPFRPVRPTTLAHGTLAAVRIDLVGTTADFRAFGPRHFGRRSRRSRSTLQPPPTHSPNSRAVRSSASETRRVGS